MWDRRVPAIEEKYIKKGRKRSWAEMDRKVGRERHRDEQQNEQEGAKSNLKWGERDSLLEAL